MTFRLLCRCPAPRPRLCSPFNRLKNNSLAPTGTATRQRDESGATLALEQSSSDSWPRAHASAFREVATLEWSQHEHCNRYWLGGLIGSEACKKFHAEGFEVVGIDNDMRAPLLRS